MTDDNKSYVSHKTPRLLSVEETVQSLNHWVALAEVFYSKDAQYEAFFEEGATWDPSAEHYGMQHKTTVDRYKTLSQHSISMMTMLSRSKMGFA